MLRESKEFQTGIYPSISRFSISILIILNRTVAPNVLTYQLLKPPFGFGRKGQPQSFTTDITDKEDLEEIKEISEMLPFETSHISRTGNPNEEVFVVARQSRLKPSGSAFTPNIVFGTDRT